MEGCCYMEQNLAEQWASQHLVRNDVADGNSYNKKGFYSFYFTTMNKGLVEWMNKKHRKCQIKRGGKSITHFLYSLYVENSRTHTDVVSHSGSCWMCVRLCWELRRFTKNVHFSCLNRWSQQGRSISQTLVCTKYRKVFTRHFQFRYGLDWLGTSFKWPDICLEYIWNYLKPD